MSSYFKILLGVFCLLVVGCGNENDPSQVIQKLSGKKVLQVFTEPTANGEQIIFGIVRDSTGPTEKCTSLLKITKIESKWKIRNSIKISESDVMTNQDINPSLIKKASFQNKEYFYFPVTESYNGTAMMGTKKHFVLLSLENLEKYEATWSYFIQMLEPEVAYSSNVKNKPELLTFLRAWMKLPGELPESQFNRVAWQKDWVKANPDLYALSNNTFDFKINKSEGNIYGDFADKTPPQDGMKSIESNLYQVYSNPDGIHALGGDVYVYDKKNRKFLTLFIQNCNYCEPTKTVFLDEYTIEMSLGNKLVVFSLDKLTYKISILE